MAQDAQRRQRAVAVPGAGLGGAPPVLRRLAHVWLATRGRFAILAGGQRRWWRRVGVGGRWTPPSTVRPLGRLCRSLRMAALVGTAAVVSSLEGAVEVDADPVAGDP